MIEKEKTELEKIKERNPRVDIEHIKKVAAAMAGLLSLQNQAYIAERKSKDEEKKISG